jgi:septal ring factor EnvC (AmiA/AmiB activator)
MKPAVVIFSLFAIVVFAQNGKIDLQKNKLSDLHNEVELLEKELKEIKQNEKTSVNLLSKINQQILTYNKIVVKLKKDELEKEIKIAEIQDSIVNIDKNINKLKKEYSAYIKWLYMFGRKEQFNYLISSKSVSQAYLRYKYFNYITEKNKLILSKLEMSRRLKIILSENYKTESEIKNKLIKEKEKEQQKLKLKKNEKETLIAQLRKDKKNIFQEIDSKQKAEIRIKDLIARLEKEDIERKKKILEAEVKKQNVYGLKQPNYSSFSNFSGMIGKLPWPVSSGTVVRAFGENTNEQLKTVTLNYGIDIKTNNEAAVHSVGDGIVSAVEWIPGYGSVVIITHSDNYRTVYGHVTDLQVDEGTSVKAGEIIGNISDTLEGRILHFEIWNKRVYQNPEIWLVRK